jgi:hypothetical protein
VGTGAHGNAAVLDEAHGVVYTPNPQPKRSGIAGFDLAATPQPVPRWLEHGATVGVPVGLLAIFVLLFVFVSRSADPTRRPQKAAPKVEGA